MADAVAKWWEAGLRIADCGFMSLFNRGFEIGIESYINPQSAIRNPTPYIICNWTVFAGLPLTMSVASILPAPAKLGGTCTLT